MGFDEPELFEDDESLISSALTNVDQDTLRYRRLRPPRCPGGPSAVRGRRVRYLAHGKVEFFSESLAALGHDPLPDFVPPRESVAGDPALAARFPLALLTPKHHTRFLNSSYSHLPKHGPVEGGPFVELDPFDAEARSISEGELVDIWNDRARLRLPARITDRLRPGVVAVPFGWWSEDHGGQGTANSLTNDTLTDWGGGVAYSDTLVQIAAAG